VRGDPGHAGCQGAARMPVGRARTSGRVVDPRAGSGCRPRHRAGRSRVVGERRLGDGIARRAARCGDLQCRGQGGGSQRPHRGRTGPHGRHQRDRTLRPGRPARPSARRRRSGRGRRIAGASLRRDRPRHALSAVDGCVAASVRPLEGRPDGPRLRAEPPVAGHGAVCAVCSPRLRRRSADCAPRRTRRGLTSDARPRVGQPPARAGQGCRGRADRACCRRGRCHRRRLLGSGRAARVPRGAEAGRRERPGAVDVGAELWSVAEHLSGVRFTI